MKEFEQMWETLERSRRPILSSAWKSEEGFQDSIWAIGAAVHESLNAQHIASPDQLATIDAAKREEERADPQPHRKGRPQRSLPLRQRQEVQELPHAPGGRGVSFGNVEMSEYAFRDWKKCWQWLK